MIEIVKQGLIKYNGELFGQIGNVKNVMFTFMNKRQTYSLVFVKQNDDRLKLVMQGYKLDIKEIERIQKELGIDD